ncbi:hypothetical protein U0R11_08185 [Aquirufa sp. 1-SAACH-A3]|uniref:DUF4177 domain-containing protein n=1 Tax=Aquirufa salirivi TaxID=3104729 RepID=A0ABW8RUF9_9BACT
MFYQNGQKMGKIEIINQSNTLWNKASLDYLENHLKHINTGWKLQMLNRLTQITLLSITPKNPLFRMP